MNEHEVAQSNENASSLFRAEATVRKSALYGSVSLAHPKQSWLVVAFAASICILIAALLAFSDYRRRASVTGIAVAKFGSATIAVPRSGFLSQVFVREGEKVAAGQRLFELSTDQKAADGDLSQLILAQLLARKSSLSADAETIKRRHTERLSVSHEKLRNSHRDYEELNRELELTLQRADLAAKESARYKLLVSKGFMNLSQAQQREEVVLDFQIKVSGLRRAKLQLDALILGINGEIANIRNSLESELAQNEQMLSSIEQEILENAGRGKLFIAAPRDGVITTINYSEGQSVESGQALANLVLGRNETRYEDLQINLYAPSRTVGFVKAGQPVLVRYQAFPYQRFGLHRGIVTDVSATPLSPQDLPPQTLATIFSPTNAAHPEAVYRVKVSVPMRSMGSRLPRELVKPGMAVDADILLDKRKLWEWVFQPAVGAMESSLATIAVD